MEKSDVTVLIVEDSPTQAMALRRALEQEHFQVIVATNGVEALAILRTQRPTLVISDIVMPEMDGCEMCRRIKDDSSLADIPVILVTSLSDPQDVIRGLQSGADNFLTKPFDKEVLVERIQNILLNRELRQRGQKTEGSMEIFFAGKKHAISVERFQIIDLLLSTFDSAIQQNQKANAALQTEVAERKRAEYELRQHKEHLEELVQRRTAELVVARDQAQAANRAKSAFLANMSHELRTPLNAVLGLAQTMQADSLVVARHKENLGTILDSGDHLLRLINDVLDITRLEAGKVDLNLQEISLGSLLNGIIGPLQGEAAAKRLTFVFERDPQVPDHIRTDPAKLRQILVKLIENAIKFTRVGQVAVRVGMEPAVTGFRLAIEIRDTGIGIAPADLGRLFRPFEQVSQKALNEGAGVGLAITRSLVELLGGTISVASDVGRGTVFHITIPVGLASSPVPSLRQSAEMEVPPATAMYQRPLAREDLQSLPADTLKTLYRLTIEGDSYELLAWMNSQNQLSPDTRAAIAAILNEYRFDILQELLEPLVKP